MARMTEERKLALLDGRRAAEQRRKDAGISITKLTPLERAKADPKSLRKAIDAKCWECEGGDADPHVSWRIGNCSCEKTCSLHPLRPYQRRKGTPAPHGL